MEDREKRNRNLGWLASVGIHSALAVLLFFVIAWRAPDPPLPEYGIELNFGLDNQGSGDVQPDQPVGDQGDAKTEETSQEASTEAAETEKSATTDEKIAEKAVETVSKTESPVSVKEEKKAVTPAKEVVKAPIQEASETPKKETTKESTTTDATKKGEATSQGDDKDKTGDKGSEQGTLNAKALYGTPGGGGGGTGLNLSMSGWQWTEDPKLPQIPDNENGKIVFEIECDDTGEIIGITTKERTLSPRAEQLLKDVIRKNSLTRTSDGKIPERSRGLIVFVLRTK
ncbi:MAG: hypothetical protein JNL40_02950 [Cyclobacteriaceae bacterium]|nr:hypothetical protein [Cyclobacteriaceae bacterium]